MSKEPDVLLDKVTGIFGMFDDEVKALDKIPKDASIIVDNVLNMVLNEKDIFVKPGEFLGALLKISDVEGHVQDTVLQIELTREKIRNPTNLLERFQTQMQPKADEQKLPQQIVVHAANEPVKTSPGWTGYFTERFRWGAMKEMLAKTEASPTITTTQKPRDILDYCRDITREYNKLVDYFQGCLDMLTIFPKSRKTYNYYYSEIRTYLCKLSNIIKTFTRAIVEYRKELVGERKESYARAITILQQAKYMAPPTSLADYYRMARMQAGAQDVGE